MSDQEAMARANLEMDLVMQAPRGALTSADGTRLPFRGWTELASVIEKWRAAERSAHAADLSDAPSSAHGEPR